MDLFRVSNRICLVAILLLSFFTGMIMLGGKLKTTVTMREIIGHILQRDQMRRDHTCSKELKEAREQAVAGLMTESTSADNQNLVSAIRDHFIDPPSTKMVKMSVPLFKTPQAEAIDKILQQKTNGFFVECGALDGERSSNTIFFEQKRDWTGLLIEMDPSWYMQLRGKNRKAYSINACISPHQYPVKMNFIESEVAVGKLAMNEKPSGPIQSAYCFPFYSMMLALNRTRIDFFSLDVEGLEVEILQTIPFDKLDIQTLSVEYKHGKDKQKYIEFMKSKGYKLHSNLDVHKPVINFGCTDYIFVKG